jgi:hypothetical protein
MPDLIASYSTNAWRVGLWVLAVVLLAWRAWSAQRRLIGIGIVWWMLGILPVLALQTFTYRHYLYPALPGLALALCCTAECVVMRVARLVRPEGRPERVLAIVLSASVLLYAVQAERRIHARLAARVAGSSLALDPVLRRQEVAQHAIASMRSFLGPGNAKIAVLSPPGAGRVFGARSGREYATVPRGGRPYNLLAESLDHGRAVRLFFPQVDTVAFLEHWTPAYDPYLLFLPAQDGSMVGVGRGARAHAETARWMLENGWHEQARDYLRDVLVAYPNDPVLRLALSGALVQLGDEPAALEELREIVRRTPEDSIAIAAREILRERTRR